MRLFLSPVVVVLLVLDLVLTGNNPEVNSALKIKVIGLSAAFLFLICAITDFLDGYLSRKWNCVSNFGKVYDPVADKILVIGSLVVLVISGRIYWPLGILIIVRDLVMDTIRVSLYKKKVVIAAIKSAKLKTISQMMGLLLFLFFFNTSSVNSLSWSDSKFWRSHIILFFSAIFSIYSFVIYMRDIYRGKLWVQ